MERFHILIMLITNFVCIFPFYLLAENSFSGEYLKVHNDARAIVGVKALIWDDELEADAQAFVLNHRVDCLDGLTLEDPPLDENELSGQNIARIPKSHAGVYAVKYWVAAKEKYDYKSNTCIGGRDRNDDCLVYVQIVAKRTTHLGCASVVCHDNQDRIVACYYYPHGTIPGQRPY
ncbi:hypothetical protein PIB30_096738 [Stylosanthes scabra]|uniref:SCP domain-containing protein n=1 Tax=Stylosanthes scabra TaxID=79078 RepID=A0ABU6SWF4_9FABA|nr:hypothetical protein [Stylosanthes scabra]